MISLSLWDYVRRLSAYWGQSRTVTAHFEFMIAVLFGGRVFGHSTYNFQLKNIFFMLIRNLKPVRKFSMYVLGSVLNA